MAWNKNERGCGCCFKCKRGVGDNPCGDCTNGIADNTPEGYCDNPSCNCTSAVDNRG